MPFTFRAYENQTGPTLANLIRAGGQDRARAVEIGGQASANAVLASGQADAQIGQAIGNTLGTLVQIPARAKQYDAEMKRVAVNDKQADEALKGYADRDLIQKVLQATGNNPEATVQELRASGHSSAADTFQSHLHETRTQALKDLDAQLTVTGKQLDLARSLLPTPPSDPTDQAGAAAYRAQYAEARPKIANTIGPDLAQHLPDPNDPDLPTKINALSEWGMSAAERLQARRLAVTIAQQGVTKAKESRDADAYFTKALGTYLATTSNQDEWDEALTNMQHLGASKETLAKFSPTFSPEAVQQAAALGESKKEPAPPALGSAADAIATWAREHKRPMESLSLAEKNRILTEHAATTRAPEKPPTAEKITPAQKAAAERWKQGELSRLEAQFRAAKTKQPFLNQMTGEFVVPPEMTDAQLEEAKQRIQASYLEQIGLTPGAPRATSAAPPQPPAAKPSATMPDLTGLKPGTARRFTEGPFAGQRWTIGPNGPMQVKDK